MSIYYPIISSGGNNNTTKAGEYAVIVVFSIIGSVICLLCICLLWGRFHRVQEPIEPATNFTFV